MDRRARPGARGGRLRRSFDDLSRAQPVNHPDRRHAHHAIRSTYDRELGEDQGRHPADGLHGRGADPCGHRAPWSRTTPTRRMKVIVDDGQINEVQRKATDADRDRDRHPAAGCAGSSLPAHAGPRLVRAGADGRPRGLGRQAGAQAGAAPAAQATTCDLPRLGERVAELVHGHHPGAGGRRRGPGARGGHPRRRGRHPVPLASSTGCWC